MAIFSRGKNFVYEMEKGWSFDGNYIPHFVELNWYFGDAPVSYHGVQKVRIHGLAKGLSKLQVSMAGMQTEYDSDYMQPQFIDLPYHQSFVTPDFTPTTSTADYSVRGISIQMKFEGRNQDIKFPEPSHVIQVLVTQSTPVSSGFRAN
ncbi:stabilization protein [Xanthomonas phage DES1]|nr:stabilization protein [Xanthomonas phage DES1]